MNRPNIFEFATKELSQDAFIVWLLQWAHPKYNLSDATLHRCAQNFVRFLLKKEGDKDFVINNVNAGRQWKNIDVWAEINDEIMLAIEDKTHTGEHSSQLERYRANVEAWCADVERGKPWTCSFVYLKTGDEASGFSEDIRAKGWHTIGRHDLVAFFNLHTDIKNDIFVDFRTYLEKAENNARIFETKPLSAWDDNQWKGFYRWLESQLEIPGKKWFYVSNPAGGFWCYVLDWEQRKNTFPLYLQIESHTGNLCFKIATHTSDTGMDKEVEDRSAIRNDYHSLLMKAAGKEQGELQYLRRPDRFGNGNYMTIAIVEPQHWLGAGDTHINTSEVLNRLAHYHQFVQHCARTWPMSEQ